MPNYQLLLEVFSDKNEENSLKQELNSYTAENHTDKDSLGVALSRLREYVKQHKNQVFMVSSWSSIDFDRLWIL